MGTHSSLESQVELTDRTNKLQTCLSPATLI